MPLLEIENLSVEFPTSQGTLRAVDRIDLTLDEGEVLGVVGESGSGKSVTMLALMGLVGYPGRVRADKLRFDGRDLLTMSARERRQLTGKDVAMIFQEPSTSLNPCFTIGFQLAETLRKHEGMDRKAAKRRAIELLEQVGIPAPESRLTAFPHQLSGGMNQRVMIAMAIACNPRLLIADEPTTALDVTIQAQILELLMSLQRERGMALVLITHNMGVVAETAQRIMVMYAGQIMEERKVDALFADPQHPYSAALLAALPERSERATPRHHSRHGAGLERPSEGLPVQPALRLCDRAFAQCPAAAAQLGGRARALPLPARRSPARCRARPRRSRPGEGGRAMTNPVIEARELTQIYPVKQGLFRAPAQLQAVNKVSFAVEAGRTLAVVGESGCGKSTLARMATLIETPTSGALTLDGLDAVSPPASERRRLRRTVQFVFQNPYGSLNPRKKVGTILEEPLKINTDLSPAERTEKARAMMAKVGLRPEHYARYPHMFSGGQRQRIAIARALILSPKVVVADEPVSALDISIQAQVLNLLADLQDELKLAYLFISHDLSVVRHIAHDVMVMYLGNAIEHGPKERIYARPLHPYTQALLASTPRVDAGKRERIILRGELPSPLNPPKGCVFSTRCPHVTDRCRVERPEKREIDGRKVACHYAEDFLAKAA